jgi:radical SAM superfamily enzyme YgiQ (UPF0313 family)
MIVNEIISLSKKHNIYNYQFIDDAIEPELFNQINHKLVDAKININYFTFMKHSNKLTNDSLSVANKAGCKMIMFGTESFSNRLLQIIKKGNVFNITKQNIEDCKQNNIDVMTWLITRIPTESIEEIQTDFETLKQFKDLDLITYVELQKLYINKNSDFDLYPNKYNITRSNGGYDFDYLDINNNVIDKAKLEASVKIYINYVENTFNKNDRINYFFRTLLDKNS